MLTVQKYSLFDLTVVVNQHSDKVWYGLTLGMGYQTFQENSDWILIGDAKQLNSLYLDTSFIVLPSGKVFWEKKLHSVHSIPF